MKFLSLRKMFYRSRKFLSIRKIFIDFGKCLSMLENFNSESLLRESLVQKLFSSRFCKISANKSFNFNSTSTAYFFKHVKEKFGSNVELKNGSFVVRGSEFTKFGIKVHFSFGELDSLNLTRKVFFEKFEPEKFFFEKFELEK